MTFLLALFLTFQSLAFDELVPPKIAGSEESVVAYLHSYNGFDELVPAFAKWSAKNPEFQETLKVIEILNSKIEATTAAAQTEIGNCYKQSGSNPSVEWIGRVKKKFGKDVPKDPEFHQALRVQGYRQLVKIIEKNIAPALVWDALMRSQMLSANQLFEKFLLESRDTSSDLKKLLNDQNRIAERDSRWKDFVQSASSLGIRAAYSDESDFDDYLKFFATDKQTSKKPCMFWALQQLKSLK